MSARNKWQNKKRVRKRAIRDVFRLHTFRTCRWIPRTNAKQWTAVAVCVCVSVCVCVYACACVCVHGCVRVCGLLILLMSRCYQCYGLDVTHATSQVNLNQTNGGRQQRTAHPTSPSGVPPPSHQALGPRLGASSSLNPRGIHSPRDHPTNSDSSGHPHL